MTRLTMQHTTRGSHRSVASTGRLIDGVKLQAFCNRVGFALRAGIAQRYSEVPSCRYQSRETLLLGIRHSESDSYFHLQRGMPCDIVKPGT
jgi:hypothetical protein